VAISRCSAASRSTAPPSSSYKTKTATAGNPSISTALSQTSVPLCSPLCKHVYRRSSSGAGDSGHLELQEEVWEVRLAMSSVSGEGIKGGSSEYDKSLCSLLARHPEAPLTAVFNLPRRAINQPQGERAHL
jgi:hypothetical protein